MKKIFTLLLIIIISGCNSSRNASIESLIESGDLDQLKKRKKEYVIITRKLRTYAKHMLKTGKIDKETYKETRKQIRARRFKSKRNLKESFENN